MEQLQQEADRLQQEMASTAAPSAGVDIPADAEFHITLDKARYGVDAGSSVSMHYTLPQAATLEVVTKEGWSAVVNAAGDKEGDIVVTAPDPASSSDILVKAATADGASLAVNLPIMVRDPYSDATRTNVAAMAYYALPTSLATDYHFKKMADAGFDMLSIEYWDNWQEQLDLAHKYGMKGVLFVNGPAGDYYRTGGTDPELERVVNYAKQHPALVAYQICDEPSVVNVNQFKYEAKAIKTFDPDHPIYLNFHPASASSAATGVETYEEYIDTYVRECELEFITFDQYPIFTAGVDVTWTESLTVVRKIGQKYNIPFWAFTLCCREWFREDPTLENIRVQCNTNLAFGAQVNQFFVYRCTSGTDYAPLQTWGWADASHTTKVYYSDDEVQYTPIYDYCKAYNAEMHNRGYIFSGCNVKEVRTTHLPDPHIVKLLSMYDLPVQIESLITDHDALVSIIENKGNEYVVIVNNSWTATNGVNAVFNDMVYAIDHDGAFTEVQPGAWNYTIEPGDMLVIKVK